MNQPLIPDFVINKCLDYLKDNIFFTGLSDDLSLWVCPGAKRGTLVYANRREEVINDIVKQFNFDSHRCLWVTCTQQVDYSSLQTIEKSFTDIKEQIPKFNRQLKQVGIVKYMYVIEAHKRGGAHLHCLLELDHSLPFHADNKDNNILRLSDEALRQSIKTAWGLGHADIQVVSSNRIAGYMVKELCKNSSIEQALDRLQKGTPKKNDTNRVWAFYFMVIRLKGMRSWGTSRNIKRQRLDSNMNNSTEPQDIARNEQSDHSINQSIVVRLDKHITRQEWFRPIAGRVEPGSVMERELMKILEPIIARRRETVALAGLALSA